MKACILSQGAIVSDRDKIQAFDLKNFKDIKTLGATLKLFKTQSDEPESL